jgi:hypothetical protein
MSRRDKGRKHTYEDISADTRIYGRVELPDPMNAYKLSYSYDLDLTRENYFGTPKMEAWRKSHEEYILSSDRILKIVKAYTYHGDRLANTYLRGVLSGLEDLMFSIRFSAEDIPIAYQIYDHYDFLKNHGIKMPEKASMMKDDKLDMTVMRTFFDSQYKKLTNQFVLRRLLKSYTDDLQMIIKKAPKFGETLYTYRGVKNENFLEPGILSYINRSFSSTSLSMDVSAKFTESYSGYRCCIYNLEIDKSVPVLCIDSVSLVKDEYEVLIGHNVMFNHNVDVKLRKHKHQNYMTRVIKVTKVPVGDFKPLFMKLSPTKKVKHKRRNFVKVNSPYKKTMKKKTKHGKKGRPPTPKNEWN